MLDRFLFLASRDTTGGSGGRPDYARSALFHIEIAYPFSRFLRSHWFPRIIGNSPWKEVESLLRILWTREKTPETNAHRSVFPWNLREISSNFLNVRRCAVNTREKFYSRITLPFRMQLKSRDRLPVAIFRYATGDKFHVDSSSKVLTDCTCLLFRCRTTRLFNNHDVLVSKQKPASYCAFHFNWTFTYQWPRKIKFVPFFISFLFKHYEKPFSSVCLFRDAMFSKFNVYYE